MFEVLEGAASAGQIQVPTLFIVARDAAATANNILANETVWRLAVASSLIGVVFHLVWGYLLYDLLRVVNRPVALFGVFVLLVNSALQAVSGILLLAPLVILKSGDSLAAFTPEQLQAVAMVLVRLNAQAYDIFLAFFGVWLITIGYLVFRSTFLPRWLGVTLALEGLGWAAYFSPPLGVALFPVIAALGLIGELPFAFWMLIKGVDNDRWRTQAAIAAGSER